MMTFSKKWLVILALSLAVSNVVSAQVKKRVAVLTFEDKTDKRYRWWDGRQPGDGMADMLTTALVKSGNYQVLEREEIGKLLAEQQLGQTGVVTEQSAAQVGQMLGVELAIMGSVTEFGNTQQETGGKIKGFRIGLKTQTATVAVDVRVVNATTGDILAAETVRKEESSSGVDFNSDKYGFKNETDFDNSLVGKATRNAINRIVELIGEQSEQLPWTGKILTVKGNAIFIKPGSDAGLKIGDFLSVYSQGEALIDPDTGISLGSIESKIGTIEITGFVAGGKAAQAVARSGGGFATGNLVRL